MIVTHPAIQGGSRALDRIERASVALYRAERECGFGCDTAAFLEWHDATKTHSVVTGQALSEVRDYAWTWAVRFADHCGGE